MATLLKPDLSQSLQDEYYIAKRTIHNFRDLGAYNPKSTLPGSGKPSDHASNPAYAFDVGGDPQSLEQFFNMMAARPGVEYVIYRNKIWSRTRGLHAYTSGGHDTHVHVSGVRGAVQNDPLTKKDVKTIAEGYLGGSVSKADAAAAGVTLTGPSYPGAGIVGGFKSVGEAFMWVGGNWDRVAEVLAGFVLVVIGLILLGRRLGMSGVPGGNLANRLQYGPQVTQAVRDPGLSKPQVVYSEGAAPRAPNGAAQGRSFASTGDDIPF